MKSSYISKRGYMRWRQMRSMTRKDLHGFLYVQIHRVGQSWRNPEISRLIYQFQFGKGWKINSIHESNIFRFFWRGWSRWRWSHSLQLSSRFCGVNYRRLHLVWKQALVFDWLNNCRMPWWPKYKLWHNRPVKRDTHIKIQFKFIKVLLFVVDRCRIQNVWARCEERIPMKLKLGTGAYFPLRK